MMTWRAMTGGRVLKGLWHVSAAFYIRLVQKEEGEDPDVLISRTQNLLWDADGTRDLGDPSGGRIRGDVALVQPPQEDGEPPAPPRLRMAIYDAAVGIQRREFYRSTTAKKKTTIFPAGADQVHVATGAAIYTRNGAGYFVREEDGDEFGYADDPLADPPGYRSWQYNERAISLTGRAELGPIAYTRAAATVSWALYGPPAAQAVADRAIILGFNGNGSPAPIAIGGEPVKGHVVGSRPVGHIGRNYVVWQQDALEPVENTNPESGYVAQDGYMRLEDEDGNVTYPRIPFNSFANWGNSPNIRYLWSARVYRVDIIEQGGGLQANRALIARSVNTWKQVPGTGDDAVKYTLERQNGQDVYVPTEEKIPAQFVPKIDDEEEPEEGYTLTAVMQRLDGSPYEYTLPFDYESPNSGYVIGFDVPGSLIEIDPSLWLAATRYSFFGLDQRWMYSRDQGATWNLIDTQFTNGNGGGATAVPMDMLLTSGAYGHAVKEEKPLTPAAQ